MRRLVDLEMGNFCEKNEQSSRMKIREDIVKMLRDPFILAHLTRRFIKLLHISMAC